jgi:hypothetical protein
MIAHKQIGWLVVICGISTAQQTWTAITPVPTTSALRDVAWTGTQFVAVGDNGTVLTSDDGSAWTIRPSGIATTLRAVIWADSVLYAAGDAGVMLTSRDGIAWLPVATNATADQYDVVAAGNQCVAVGTGAALLSPNGTDWTRQSIGSLDTLTGVAWTGKTLVAVGCNSVILSSVNGIAWTPQSSGFLDWMYGIAAHKGLLTIVGYNYSAYNCYGTALTSTDGVQWTRRFAGTTRQVLYGLTAAENLYVAVGYYGTILTSPDAQTWSPCSSGTTRKLQAVTFSATTFVAVGDRGTILISPRSTSASIDPKQNGYSSMYPHGIKIAAVTRNRLAFSWNRQTACMLKLQLLDLSGRSVFSLLGTIARSGSRRIDFDSPMAAGCYLLVADVGDARLSKTISIH